MFGPELSCAMITLLTLPTLVFTEYWDKPMTRVSDLEKVLTTFFSDVLRMMSSQFKWIRLDMKSHDSLVFWGAFCCFVYFFKKGAYYAFCDFLSFIYCYNVRCWTWSKFQTLRWMYIKNVTFKSKLGALACLECSVCKVTSTSSSWWRQIIRASPQIAFFYYYYFGSDSAQTCMDAFQKLTFWAKNEEKKLNPKTVVCLHSRRR